MNVLELKGSIFELIAQIDNPKSLSRVHAFLKHFNDDSDDNEEWDKVPPVHQERILNAYKESFNSENWVNHEDVKKQHAKWLQK